MSISNTEVNYFMAIHVWNLMKTTYYGVDWTDYKHGNNTKLEYWIIYLY